MRLSEKSNARPIMEALWEKAKQELGLRKEEGRWQLLILPISTAVELFLSLLGVKFLTCSFICSLQTPYKKLQRVS